MTHKVNSKGDCDFITIRISSYYRNPLLLCDPHGRTMVSSLLHGILTPCGIYLRLNPVNTLQGFKMRERGILR